MFFVYVLLICTAFVYYYYSTSAMTIENHLISKETILDLVTTPHDNIVSIGMINVT